LFGPSFLYTFISQLLIKTKTKVMSNENKSVKRGRPAVEGSARQARLAARAARVAAGGEVKRGRPANTSSARQAKLAVKAAKVAAGEAIKRGRPSSKPQTAFAGMD
jgi:hypothetical protein